jgi:hypothetical protein
MVWQAMSDNGGQSFPYTRTPSVSQPNGNQNLYVQVMGDPRHLTFRHVSLLASLPAVAPGPAQWEAPEM